MFGELIPMGGGDTVPLVKRSLLVGRRESCDIVLRFSNVSAHHCQLSVNGGYWYVKDLGSKNGVKVNGVRIGTSEKLLEPGDEVAVAKHNYTIQYAPYDIGAVGPPPCRGVVKRRRLRSLASRCSNARALSKADLGGRDSGPLRRFRRYE